MKNEKVYIFGLCFNRHRAPVKEGIFPTNVPYHHNFEWYEEYAESRIPKDCTRLAVYVTGLTVAMLGVVAACKKRGIRLTAYHYSESSGRYKKQEVL